MKQQLIDFVKKSDLSEADKAQWEALIVASPDEFAVNFWELFQTYPQEMVWFNEIIKRKKEAFEAMKSDSKKSSQMLAQIYEEEKNKLEELASKNQ